MSGALAVWPAVPAGAGDCACLDGGAPSQIAARIRLRWVSTADFTECQTEADFNVDLEWGIPFATLDDRCARRAQVRMPTVPAGDQTGCGGELRLMGPAGVALSIASMAPGSCFPARLSLELPVAIEQMAGGLRTERPVPLEAELAAFDLQGTRLLKPPNPVPLFPSNSPDGGPPAGFLLGFEVELQRCDCGKAPPRPRAARVSGQGRFVLYGLAGEWLVDFGGEAAISRSIPTPVQDPSGLLCRESMLIHDLRLAGFHRKLGQVTLSAAGGLQGASFTLAEGCTPQESSLQGGLTIEVPSVGAMCVGDGAVIDLATERQDPLLATASLGVRPLQLHLEGDAGRLPAGELRRLELRIDERNEIPCLPAPQAVDFSAAARITLDSHPSEPLLADGHLRLEYRPARDQPAGADGSQVDVTIVELDLAGSRLQAEGASPVGVTAAAAPAPAGRLSAADPDRCESLVFDLAFTPRLLVDGRFLITREPVLFHLATSGPLRPGDRLKAALPAELVESVGGAPAGRMSAFELELLPRLHAPATAPFYVADLAAAPASIELPVEFPLNIVDLDLAVDLLHSDLSELEAALVGPPPDRMRVILFQAGDLRARGRQRLRVRFGDEGRALAPPFDLGETVAPIGPGLRPPFGAGIWTVELRSRAPSPAWLLVRELAAELVPRGTRDVLEPVLGLTASPVGCTTLVSWESPALLDAARFLRDGRLLVLDPPFSHPSFFDPDPFLTPGRHQYAAISTDAAKLLAVHDVQVSAVPPVEDVTAEESGGLLRLRWSNPVSSDFIEVDVDGEPYRLLPGGVSRFDLPAALARGRMVCLTRLRCQMKSERRCRPVEPEGPISSLGCRVVAGQVELDIEGDGPYAGFTVYRDGTPIQSLTAEERIFFDPSVLVTPGRVLSYCVEPFFASGRTAEPACCQLRFPSALRPICTVLLPELRAVSVGVEGEVGEFESIVVVREDRLPFDMHEPLYVIRDLNPPGSLERSGVTYYLTSQYQGVAYPVAQCVAVTIGAFVRGDCNGDRAIDISDVLAGLWMLFGGQWAPCAAACDANADKEIDIADSIFILQYLFLGQREPPLPFPACGSDRGEPDEPSCARPCY